jgi:hypothetical protein
MPAVHTHTQVEQLQVEPALNSCQPSDAPTHFLVQIHPPDNTPSMAECNNEGVQGDATSVGIEDSPVMDIGQQLNAVSVQNMYEVRQIKDKSNKPRYYGSPFGPQITAERPMRCVGFLFLQILISWILIVII